MLETKLNGFLKNGFKYRKISQLFEELPRKSETNAFKSFICRREPFGHLRAIRELQIIIFVLNNLTVYNVYVYTKKIFPSVSVASVSYLPSHEPLL